MARDFLRTPGLKRRGIISWMIAALLLPVLLGLLPQPAVSAETALDRAIAESLCGGTGPVRQQDRHGDEHQHCILFHAGTLHCLAGLPAGAGLTVPHPQDERLSLTILRKSAFAHHALHRDGSPPTGPPRLV